MAEKPHQRYNRLVNRFIDGYTKKYGTKPVVNRNDATWVMRTLLEDFSEQELIDIIDFYFAHINHSSHSFEWFKYNYHIVHQAMLDRQSDMEMVARLQRESELRAKEWKDKLERIRTNRRSRS